MIRKSINVAVFHPGTQHSWQTAMALDALGLLEFYATSIFYQPDRFPYKLAGYLPGPVRRRVEREFKRFEQPGLDFTKVRTSGIYEWVERIANRAGCRKIARLLDRVGNKSFARGLAKTVRSDREFALWGYNASSEDLFRLARQEGRACILDRTIGDWRAYNIQMDAAYREYPGFFTSSDYAISQQRIDADDREYELANVILAGSDFSARSILNHSSMDVKGRVRTIRYCYDEQLFGDFRAPSSAINRPVRFLFLGQAGPRKGIHLVLKAFERVPRSAATLTIVGDLQIPRETFARYADLCDYRRTVPRSEVPALMAASDVFLFPTYFEGAGIVLYEALASGNALIQSRNADIAVSPETGILLDKLDEESLYSAMMAAIEDRNRLAGWRANSQAAALRYRFANYQAEIAAMLDDLEMGHYGATAPRGAQT